MSFLKIPEIDVQQLATRLRSEDSFVLLDVREAWELDHAMLVDSRLKVVPTSRLAQLGTSALPEEVLSVRGGIDDYAKQVDVTVGKY